MEIEIQLTTEPIAEKIPAPASLGAHGAWLEFRGVVRGDEDRKAIAALEYEAYEEMARKEMRRILELLAGKYPCLAVKIIHRVGVIPVGDTAIYAGVAAAHRGEAIGLLAEFMDRLKEDVPIWKRKAIPLESPPEPAKAKAQSAPKAPVSLDQALAEICARAKPLEAVRAPLADALGRTLRETVLAPADLPDCDRSMRDGYAILQNDESETFHIVDTLHAADWRPRQLKSGEAVRIATGAALPGQNLRVVMQENAERNGDTFKITRRSRDLNIRKRGEEIRAGQVLLESGTRLEAGALSLLASVGCVQPLASRRLRVAHFTTGDEIVPPEAAPEPGQIRDSHSTLIRGLLQTYPCELTQRHLPENFEWRKPKYRASNFSPPGPISCWSPAGRARAIRILRANCWSGWGLKLFIVVSTCAPARR